MAENKEGIKVTSENEMLDTNKDGVIDNKDMTNRITATTEELKKLDANGDGYVDADDLMLSGITLSSSEQEILQPPSFLESAFSNVFSTNPLTATSYYPIKLAVDKYSSWQENNALEEQRKRYSRIEEVLSLSKEEANIVRESLGLDSLSQDFPAGTGSTSNQSVLDIDEDTEAAMKAYLQREDGTITSRWLGLDNLALANKLETEQRTFTREELEELGFKDLDNLTRTVAYVYVGGEKRLVKYETGDDTREIQELSKDLKGLFNFRQMAWISGYYGNKKPSMISSATTQDVEVMRKIMSDSNITGSDWMDYITPIYEKNSKYGAPITAEEAAKLKLEEDKTGKAAVQELEFYAMDNNINLSKSYMNRKQKEIVAGTKTVDDVKQEIRDVYLKPYYPSYSNDLDRGLTIKELVEPYTDVLARTLEIPAPDNPMSDNLIKQVLSYKDEKGVPAKMPIWQFEQMVKQDERWQYTDNAYNEIFNRARQIGNRI